MRGAREPLGGPAGGLFPRWRFGSRPLTMENSSLPAVELVVRTIAETAIANETYFCQLDSVVGDGDFGYSLARGFEKVLENFAGVDRSSPGAFRSEEHTSELQ